MGSIKISKDVYWIGALDSTCKMADATMFTPYGTTYNSYAIKGDKIAVFDTVKYDFLERYLQKLNDINIDIPNIDYVILSNSKPNNSGALQKLLEHSPNLTVVGTNTTISLLKKIINRNFNFKIVKDNETLSLGNKTLKFISTPFVNWPDSLAAYIMEDKLLLSGDCFSCHFCNSSMFTHEIDDISNYFEAYKYYFQNLFKPYKFFVTKALLKFQDLELLGICPSNGPIIKHNPLKSIKIYKDLCNNNMSSKKVSIVYTSSYGYTLKLAEAISNGIKSQHNIDVILLDIKNFTSSELLEVISESEAILFGSPTISGEIPLQLRILLANLTPLTYGGKFAGAFGSYGWSGEAVNKIYNRLDELKMKIFTPGLSIKLNPNRQDLISAFQFGANFCKFIHNEKIIDYNTKNKNKKKELFTEPHLQLHTPIYKQINTRDTFVIIGNGISGFTVAKTIRHLNSTCKIKIVSGSTYSSYNKSRLCYVDNVSSDNDNLYFENSNWYKENNIEELLGKKVSSIDEENNLIYFQDNSKLEYSKLIIATGSNTYIPNVKIINTNNTNLSVTLTPILFNKFTNIFSLSNIDDLLKIKENLSSDKTVTIIGAGSIGLELAYRLNKYVKGINIIESSTYLLSNLLDYESSLIINNYVKNNNINIYTNCLNYELHFQDRYIKGIKLQDNNFIESDLILFCTGLRPNKSFLNNSSINSNIGINVDKYMKTNIDNIYACGDVVEFNNKTYNSLSTCINTATSAAYNACGITKEFNFNSPPHIIHTMNTSIFSVGDLNFIDNSYDSLSSKNISLNQYCKLFFKNNILVGGILIGDLSKSNLLIQSINKKLSKEQVLNKNIL